MNAFITYSGWLASIGSIILSIFLYKKNKLQKRVELSQESCTIIKFPDNMEVYRFNFLGKEIVGSLTKIHFKIKNKGNTGIESTDLRKHASIELDIDNGVAVGAYTGKNAPEGARDPSVFNVKDNEIEISWNYIDPSEEFDIFVYTTGTFKGGRLRGNFKSDVITKTRINGKSTPGSIFLGGVIIVALFLLSDFFSVGYSDLPPLEKFLGRVPVLEVRDLIYSILGLLTLVVAVALGGTAVRLLGLAAKSAPRALKRAGKLA